MDDIPRLRPTMVSRKLLVLQFIQRFHAEHGEGPTISEICAGCGDCARSRVQEAIGKLEREQRIHRIPDKMRGITPITDHEEALRQFEAKGWTVDRARHIITPPGAMPLIDIDANGELVVIQPSGTKACLPFPPARAHEGRDVGGSAGGKKGEEDGAGGTGAAA